MATIETKVISKTMKKGFPVAVKRMVLETATIKNGKKLSRTYHEVLRRNGKYQRRDGSLH